MAQPITQNEALLKRIVIVLGVLLVLGTIGLVIAMILKPSGSTVPGSDLRSIGGVQSDLPLVLPALEGREIVETTIEGGTLLLRLAGSDGAQEIWVIDMATGDIVRKFGFTPDP